MSTMVSFFKGISFNSIFVTLFCLSAIFCNDEKTADPGIVYVGLIMIPVILYYYMEKNRANIIIFSLVCSIALSALISITLASEQFTSTTLKYYLFLWFYAVVSSIKFSNDNIYFIFKTFAVISVFLSLVIIYSFLTGQTYYDAGAFRFSLNSIGLDKNPNYVTAFINISFFSLYYSLITKKTTAKRKIIIILSLVIMLVSFYLSGTRAAILTVIISLVSALFFINQNKSSLKYIFLVSFVIIVLVIYYWEPIMGYSDVFLGGRTMTEDNGRTETWRAIMIAFWDNDPIFGFGPSVAANIGIKYGTIDYLHNIFLEILVGHGILGFLLYVILFLIGWKRVNNRDKMFLAFFLLVTGFPLMFQNGFMAVNFWRFAILNRILVNSSSIKNQVSMTINKIG